MKVTTLVLCGVVMFLFCFVFSPKNANNSLLYDRTMV